MTKRLVILFAFFALLLAGCAQAEQTSEPTATPTQAIVEKATAEPQAATQEVAAQDVAKDATATPPKPARCYARSLQPTPNPTVQALLPPIDAQDWAKGPADARVSIIEYGDYQ